MDPTTTDEPILPDDGATPESSDAIEQPAATEPAEPTTTQTEPDEAPSGSDENLEWLKNKGIDPSDPDAIGKVAEMYRNAERQMHESTAKASNLEKSLKTTPAADSSPDEDLIARVQRMETAQNVNAFWTEHPEAKQYEEKMTEIVTSRPEIGQLVNAGYFSISDLYNLARGGDANRDEGLMAKGGKEALEKVAKKQQAKAIPGSAVSSDLSLPEEDPVLSVLKAD